jgi:catechol 2,3-dioxygenase-like lactoylglutathione lyase family enzyme
MVHHVTREIPASELERCIAFYESLGFQAVPVPAGVAGRAVWLESSGTQIHLLRSAGAEPDDRQRRQRDAGHVGVVVEGYEATVERLVREGHSVEPRREHWGSPRSYVRDPAGNLVELIAWAPGRE